MSVHQGLRRGNLIKARGALQKKVVFRSSKPILMQFVLLMGTGLSLGKFSSAMIVYYVMFFIFFMFFVRFFK